MVELSPEQRKRLEEIQFDPEEVTRQNNIRDFEANIVGITRISLLKKRVMTSLGIDDKRAETVLKYMKKGYIRHDDFSDAIAIITRLEKPTDHTDF